MIDLLICSKKIPVDRCKEIIEAYSTDSIIIDDQDYSVLYRNDFKSAALTKEILEYFPQLLGKTMSIRWYFTMYEQGGFIKEHTDGHVNIGSHNSTHTVIIYLNDDYKGGELVINNVGTFHPEMGTIVIMNSDLLHSVRPLLEGNKYILRSDIVYK